jgi:hypothetical protein
MDERKAVKADVFRLKEESRLVENQGQNKISAIACIF